MRLLFVCERLPWPAHGGPAVRTLAQLRGLAELGHELEIVAFAAGAEPPPPPPGLAVRVRTVDSPGEATAADWLRDGGASALPWAVRQRASATMRAAVAERATAADVVVAVKLPMAQYLGSVDGPLRVYDALDVESLALVQVARLERGGGLVRVHAAREAVAVEGYERRLADLADVVTTVTEADASALGALAPGVAVRSVPIGLDATEYPLLWRPGTPRLAFVGDLGWPPNSDAAAHLCEDVLPLLSAQAGVTIAGRRPGAQVRRLARPGVEITGAVPAMDAVLAGDTVTVAPLRAGTGMRVKLLEAMAWGLPSVSSTIGCAGIDHGGALLVADGAERTAAAIDALLADEEQRAALSRAGRDLVAARYGYRESAAGLLDAIGAATGTSSARRR